MHLSYLAKIEEARALWINIAVNYCQTRVQSYTKILKEIETKETIRFFCHVFIIGSNSIRGGGEGVWWGLPGPPWLRQ